MPWISKAMLILIPCSFGIPINSVFWCWVFRFPLYLVLVKKLILKMSHEFLEWQSCHSYAEGYGFYQNYIQYFCQTLVITDISKPMLCHSLQCYDCFLSRHLCNFWLTLFRNTCKSTVRIWKPDYFIWSMLL